jgi:hypothetical protein
MLLSNASSFVFQGRVTLVALKPESAKPLYCCSLCHKPPTPHAPCVNSTITAASISEMLQDSLLHIDQLSEVGVSQPFQNRHG